MIDLYSDCIRAMYKRYHDNKIIDTVFDGSLLLDFEVVSQARTKYLAEDAKNMADELADILKDEVLYRMGLWRQQARSFSDNVYDMITNGERRF